MQSNMLLNQSSKQHFKLSKKFSHEKNVKHLDPKHTLNKSNQFYISKTSTFIDSEILNIWLPSIP